MGNPSQTFKVMCTTLFILFLLSYTASSHSSSFAQEIQPQQNPPSTTTPTHYYQVFYLKNTDSTALSKQERFKKRRIKRNKNTKHRKKMAKNMQQSRPFSAMLPKGFVPPSGSSPCHNDQPNSVSSFHCRLTTAEP